MHLETVCSFGKQKNESILPLVGFAFTFCRTINLGFLQKGRPFVLFFYPARKHYHLVFAILRVWQSKGNYYYYCYILPLFICLKAKLLTWKKVSSVLSSFLFCVYRSVSNKQTNQSSWWQCVHTLSNEEWNAANWRWERPKDHPVGSWFESWKGNWGKKARVTRKLPWTRYWLARQSLPHP